MQSARRRGAYQQASSGLRFRSTPCYTEFENHLDDGSFGIIYVIPAEGHSYSIYACVPDATAELINKYVALNPDTQRSTIGIYRKTWPLLATLRSNGLAGQHIPAALAVVEDPDYRIKRWVVTTTVGNLPALSSAEILNDVRLMESMLHVSDTSEALLKQVATSPINPHRWAHARWRDDLKVRAELTIKFIDDNTEPIAKLFKLLGV
jgi:hypothetical protein